MTAPFRAPETTYADEVARLKASIESAQSEMAALDAEIERLSAVQRRALRATRRADRSLDGPLWKGIAFGMAGTVAAIFFALLYYIC
jgi:hypothetical protein